MRKPTAADWGGDDWGSFAAGPTAPTEYESLSKGSADSASSSSSSSSSSLTEGTEVKIKISKQQLEQILKSAEVEGLTAQEMLSKLLNGGDNFESNQRSWKPALQSIPE